MASLLLLAGCGDPPGGASAEAAAQGESESLWILSPPDRSVMVVDAVRGEVVARVDLGFRSDPGTIDAGSGSIWVGNAGGSLQRIDAETHRLADTHALDIDVWTVSAASHGIFAMDGERGILTRHDTGSGELLATIDVPDRIHAMGAAPEATAVVLGDRRELLLFPPGADEPVVVEAEPGGGDLVAGFGSFWIYHPDGVLYRLHPGSGAVQSEIALEPDLYFPGIAVGGGAVWVAVPERREVLKIDPADSSIVSVITTDGDPAHAAWAAGALWIVLPWDDAVVRVNPQTGEETARLGIEYPTRIVAGP